MPRCRVVMPDVVRLPLSDGDWIDVQRELNAGDYYDFLTAWAAREPFAKILAYVLGWSFIGPDGQPLTVAGPDGTAQPYSLDVPANTRRDLIRSLDKETTKELLATLDRHEAAQDAIRIAKKKTPTTAPTSSPPSESVAP